MSYLYIITGPAGVGKSTISKQIASSRLKSVLIEGDDIYHQVVGGYSPPWESDNHLKVFWEICLNSIKTYLESGYDVVFNYIVNPENLDIISKEFTDYNIKFIVLMANEKVLLRRDKERPENRQMQNRCTVLLNKFKKNIFNSNFILDTSLLSIIETVQIIENDNRFILHSKKGNSSKLVFRKNIPEMSVTNLKASLDFYKCAGFKIEYERPENKFAFISLGEIQFMLQEITNNDKWDIAPLSYPFGNGINFQLEVESVDDIYNNFINSGYKIAFDIEENWYRQDNRLLGNKEFLIQDCDGYLLRFSEDLGEKKI